MSNSIETTVENDRLISQITMDSDCDAPVWQFSLMAPADVLSGGTLLKRTGGFMEVALPPIAANTPHQVVLRHLGPPPKAINRAWFPTGSVIATDNSIVQLTSNTSTGAITRPWPNTAEHGGLGLIPPPTNWNVSEGRIRGPFHLEKSHLFEGLLSLVRRLGHSFISESGIPIVAQPDQSLPKGAYHLKIEHDRVTIRASDAIGYHYAGISLLFFSITRQDIPCGTITDTPRFDWRGQHLDCARHFFEVDTILKLLDLMALLKMNKFHWHFSDDEAFRIALASLPELNSLNKRGPNEHVPAVFGGTEVTNGVYSRDDIAKIKARARSLHIDIVPEIEIPAHALGLCRAFPKTRDPNDLGTEESVQGYQNNILNPACAETWRVIEAMISDLSKLFPGSVLHLGGDELPEGAWSESPLVEQLKVEHNLTSHYDVQGWTMAKAAHLAKKNGFRPAAWEESQYGSQGGIGSDAILFSWTGQEPGKSAARMGYDVVMCPAQHTYLDMAHSTDPDDWGASWAACFDLEDTVNWTPVHPDEPSMQNRVIGVEGTFWSEFTNHDWQLEAMLAPRIFGVACMGWCEAPPQGDALIALAKGCHPIWDALGWQSFYTL